MMTPKIYVFLPLFLGVSFATHLPPGVAEPAGTDLSVTVEKLLHDNEQLKASIRHLVSDMTMLKGSCVQCTCDCEMEKKTSKYLMRVHQYNVI